MYIIARMGFQPLAFLMEPLRGFSEVSVLAHEVSRKSIIKSIVKHAEARISSVITPFRYYSDIYLQQLYRIKSTDSVLIFGIEDLAELHVLRKYISTRRCTVFLWNPIRSCPQTTLRYQLSTDVSNTLRDLNMKVVTFDREDAYRYGLTLVEQVYRDVGTWQSRQFESEVDLYFLGQDKARLPILQKLIALFNASELSHYFHIVRDEQIRYTSDQRAILQSAPMPYLQNVDWIMRSRCLVEIVQDHQSGPTLRSLEAAFFGKKLLTNRVGAREDMLYDPDRVWIFNQHSNGGDADSLKAFITRPHAPIDPTLLSRHDIAQWWRQFVD